MFHKLSLGLRLSRLRPYNPAGQLSNGDLVRNIALVVCVMLASSMHFGCSQEKTTIIEGVDGTATAADGGNGADTSDGSEGTDSVDGTSGGNGSSAGLGEIDSGIPADPIEAVCSPQFFDIPVGESTACADAMQPSGVTGWPFSSASYTPAEGENAGTQYSWNCTMCPDGRFPLEGRYKFYRREGDSLLLDQPSPTEYMEIIEFRGNAWSLSVYWDQGNGSILRSSERGYYFCAEPGTLPGINSFFADIWVITKAVPEGALADSGTAFPAFIGISTLSAGNDVIYALNNEWNSKGNIGSSAGWCKIGSKVEGRDCPDPCKQLADLQGN